MQPFSALLLIQAFPDNRLRKIKEEVLAHDAILKNKLDSRPESQRDVSDMIWFIWLFIISVPDQGSAYHGNIVWIGMVKVLP